MNNQTIKSVLKDKGIFHLYHVNSVATAITFLRNGGLLSRGFVEDNGLFQTPQNSDSIDKEMDVFYDIFFDSVDIHHHSRRLNYYGPVVFIYSIDLIDVLPPGQLKITKDNPLYWTPNMTETEKYFLEENELRACFYKGEFKQHITLHHQYEPLSFDFLEKIIIDNPGVSETNYFKDAYHNLQTLTECILLDVPIEVRQCTTDCICKTQYRSFGDKYIYHKFRTK